MELVEWFTVMGLTIATLGVIGVIFLKDRRYCIGVPLIFFGVVVSLSGLFGIDVKQDHDEIHQAAEQQGVVVSHIDLHDIVVATNESGKCFIKAKMTGGEIITDTVTGSSQLVTTKVIRDGCQ